MKKLVLIITCAIMLFSCGDGKPTEIDAELEAQYYIQSLLKSPGTTDFRIAKTYDYGDGEFSVESYVESENGFGGIVRTNYSCTVKFTPDGKKRTISNVKIDQLQKKKISDFNMNFIVL